MKKLKTKRPFRRLFKRLLYIAVLLSAIVALGSCGTKPPQYRDHEFLTEPRAEKTRRERTKHYKHKKREQPAIIRFITGD